MKFDQLSSILQIKPTENNYQFWISSGFQRIKIKII